MSKAWIAVISVGLASCGAVKDHQDEQRAKEVIAARLFDPESARFQKLRISTVTTPQGSLVRSVCGEFNGKNRLGGYVGFQPFAYVVKREVSPAETQRTGRHNWEAGDLGYASSGELGTLADMDRICRDGAVLSEDDINLSTPNF